MAAATCKPLHSLNALFTCFSWQQYSETFAFSVWDCMKKLMKHHIFVVLGIGRSTPSNGPRFLTSTPKSPRHSERKPVRCMEPPHCFRLCMITVPMGTASSWAMEPQLFSTPTPCRTMETATTLWLISFSVHWLPGLRLAFKRRNSWTKTMPMDPTSAWTRSCGFLLLYPHNLILIFSYHLPKCMQWIVLGIGDFGDGSRRGSHLFSYDSTCV